MLAGGKKDVRHGNQAKEREWRSKGRVEIGREGERERERGYGRGSERKKREHEGEREREGGDRTRRERWLGDE